jgi:hypothetical protein
VEEGKLYFYYLEDIDLSGMRNKSRVIEVTMAKKALPKVLLPKEFALLQNYPNPFNPETYIPFHLAKEAEVEIRIYDFKGRLVKEMYLGQKGAGYYVTKEKAAYWDGRNEAGEAASSGVYFYQLRAGNFAATKKMVVVK